MFLRSIHYFRAVAIVAIVAGHCYGLAAWWIHTVGDKTAANLITGGTSLFVFISGFLFHHVFYPKFRFGSFIGKKVHYVLVPYLVLSAIALVPILSTGTGSNAERFVQPGTGIYGEYLRPIVLYLWTGGVNFTYWYIPFIMVMFLLSPAFIAYINARAQVRWTLFAVFLAVSLVIHRPLLNLSVLQSVVYFVPVYMFGILTSIHKERVYALLGGKEFLLAAVVVTLALLQAVFVTKDGNFHKNPLDLAGLDMMLIQKLILCLLLVVFLHRLENVRSAVLDKLAEGSFAIFFIHPFLVLNLEGSAAVRALSRWIPDFPLLRLGIMTAVVVMGSLLIAMVIKKLFRGCSRFVVGW